MAAVEEEAVLVTSSGGTESNTSSSLPPTPLPRTSSKDNNNDNNLVQQELNESSSNNHDDDKSGPVTVRYNRIFKKVSQDGNLVLFLPQRELIVTENNVESLMGIALIHENVTRAKNMKVFLHIVLIFRFVL